jgi:hypothetical protein
MFVRDEMRALEQHDGQIAVPHIADEDHPQPDHTQEEAV